MSLLSLSLVLLGLNVQATTLDCQGLDLSGTWSVSLDPRYPLQGIYDQSSISFSASRAAVYSGVIHYQGIDSIGVYYERTTQVTASVNRRCELTIKRKSEHIDFLRSFENPKANPSSSDLVYASGEGEVSFQIKGTSTNNTLELDNGSILSR
jgi:hypothetical protein